MIRNVSWAANQHIRMISEGSRDSEIWSNDARNSDLYYRITHLMSFLSPCYKWQAKYKESHLASVRFSLSHGFIWTGFTAFLQLELSLLTDTHICSAALKTFQKWCVKGFMLKCVIMTVFQFPVCGWTRAR